MTILDFDRLASIDPSEFQGQKPYSWTNPEGVLTPEAYETLRAELPEVERFEAIFGRTRKFGQRSHDRFVLEYTPDLDLTPTWRAFIDELSSDRYRDWLCTVSGTPGLQLRFHWHYTPAACEVSPHCDSKHKLGSHIFYFNTEDDWDPAWGGQTVILDDRGRFESNSAPDFGDFDDAISSEAIGNRSLLFMRRGNSWHGVREITCPEGRYRKVFIVVIERVDPGGWLRRALRRWLGT